ncbi:MAG: hypothetical protein U0736_06275 [Gemmataceae bacterium]
MPAIAGDLERIVPVTTLPPLVRYKAVRERRDLEVGYFYRHYLFGEGFDLWTWGGRWVLFAGTEYWPLTDAQLNELLGAEQAASLGRPLRYTFPPGLLVLLVGAVGVAILVWRGEAGNRRKPGGWPTIRGSARDLTSTPPCLPGRTSRRSSASGRPPGRDRLAAGGAGPPGTRGRSGTALASRSSIGARSYELRHLALNLEHGRLYDGRAPPPSRPPTCNRSGTPRTTGSARLYRTGEEETAADMREEGGTTKDTKSTKQDQKEDKRWRGKELRR